MLGIITVFYSENCGSVLQAYAMSVFLKQLGFESQFVLTKNKNSSHSIKRLILRIGKQLLSGNIKGARCAINRYVYFQKLITKYFPFFRWNSSEAKSINTFILGSDTVWDVERDNFLELSDIFWPRNRNINVVVYGASVANSTVGQLKKLKYPEESLKLLKSVSVRDRYSEDVITSLTEKNVTMVCDPTLLVDKTSFNCFRRSFISEPYLVMYLFEIPDAFAIQQIFDFAQEKKCKIISIGKQIKNCDEIVDATVDNFITYFSNADYVVTNTFHGTIFSIIYEKKFISLANEKKKVVDFLGEIGLKNQLYVKNNFSIILDRKIDYDMVNIEIQKLRKQSRDYLIKNISFNKEEKEKNAY